MARCCLGFSQIISNSGRFPVIYVLEIFSILDFSNNEFEGIAAHINRTDEPCIKKFSLALDRTGDNRSNE
jgi:hypothetical protein